MVIGFAAETENVMENARKKLNAKLLDAIVVNDVSKPGIGFDSDRNAVTIVTADKEMKSQRQVIKRSRRESCNW